MKQRGGVNEFDNRRKQVSARVLVSQCARYQQQQCWAQALAASRNDVVRYLADQRHFRLQAVLNDAIELRHILSDEA